MKKFLVLLILFCFCLSAAANERVKNESSAKYYSIRVDVIDLPWLHGFGRIDDLQLRASQDEYLRQFIKKLASMNSANHIYADFDKLLSMWTGTTETELSMQKFILTKFMQIPKEEIEKYKPENIRNAYKLLKDMLYVDFIAQTSFGKNFDINYDYAQNKLIPGEKVYENIIKNMTDSYSYIASYIIFQRLVRDKTINTGKLASAIKHFGYGAHLITYSNSGSDLKYFKNVKSDGKTPLHLFGSLKNDRISGANTPDIIYGNRGNDLIRGGSGDDFLHGGFGNDRIYGEDGSDILAGAEGFNLLEGGGGNDIYIYTGVGNDSVKDEKYGKLRVQRWYWDNRISDYKDKWVDKGKILVDGGNDTVIFSEQLSREDFVIKRKGNDLVFTLKNNDNSLTLKNWYKSKEQRIENFKFSDGTELDVDKLYEIEPEHNAIIRLFKIVYSLVISVFA